MIYLMIFISFLFLSDQNFLLVKLLPELYDITGLVKQKSLGL